jgi:hypothetical protein
MTEFKLPPVTAQNKRGEYVPAIPLPMFVMFGRKKCACGKTFRNERRYREHYALVHALALDD